MQTLNEYRWKLMERLHETMNEANLWKEQVEQFDYLWLDNREEHLQEFLLYGRSLNGKKSIKNDFRSSFNLQTMNLTIEIN